MEQRETIPGSPIPNPESYKRTLCFLNSLHMFNTVNIERRENIPENEPLLIVANHRGTNDIPIVARTMRPFGLTRFVAKDDFAKNRIVGRKMHDHWGAIWINRKNSGSDIIAESLKTFKYEEDPYLAIFPEGGRVKENPEKISKVSLLVAQIACYANVRVLPVGIWGTHEHQFPGFSNVEVVVGKPLDSRDLSESYNPNADRQRTTNNDKEIIRGLSDNIHKSMQDALDIARENHKYL